MVCRMFASHIVILLLVVSTSLVLSKKTTTPYTTKDVEEEILDNSDRLQPSESKLKNLFKVRRGEGRNVPHEDDGKGEKDEEIGSSFSKKTTTPSTKDVEDELLEESGRRHPSESKQKTLYKGRRKEGRYEDDGKRRNDDDFVDWKKSTKDVDPDKEESDFPQISESKLKSRYKGRRGEGRYVLHEDDGEGGKDMEFVHEEGNEEHEEEEADRGYHNDDKKVDDETLKEYSIKGTDQDFREGGASFDKHHKDLATQNKENEHVNEHDEGEKFGAEALKEHKLGKHREKSVGHKKHGFKNVYHKEEYGDHKTFHDEFLDNDHHHEYDDQHENRKLEGGRFSKGYWKEGENKELDEGDENHAWGKGGHDSEHEGKYEEGGHITGHRQGHKKREGHHEASGHKHKQAKHKKVKNGEVPHHSTTHHHDEQEPEYYSRNYKYNDDKEDYSKVFSSDVDSPQKTHKKHKSHAGKVFSYPKADLADIGEDHRNRHQVPESFSSEDIIGGDHYPKEFRTKSRLPEPIDDVVEPIRNELPRRTPVENGVRISKPLPASENHSFYYRSPQTEIVDQIPVTEGKPFVRAPQLPDVDRYKPVVAQPSPKQHHHIQHLHDPHYHQPGVFPTQLSGSNPSHHHHDDRNHHHNGKNHHLDDRNHHHRHVVVSQPVVNHEPRSHHYQNPQSTVSKPYPWWKHSSRPGDSAQASSQHRFGRERVPQHHSSWVPHNKFRYSEPYENVASRPRGFYGYTRAPEYHNVQY